MWAVYQDDAGGQYALRVDADEAADPVRGWVTPAPEGLIALPRGWRPRRMVGVDESGRTQRTRVASINAPLWRGDVDFWTFETTDPSSPLGSAAVIGRVKERPAFARQTSSQQS